MLRLAFDQPRGVEGAAINAVREERGCVWCNRLLPFEDFKETEEGRDTVCRQCRWAQGDSARRRIIEAKRRSEQQAPTLGKQDEREEQS